MRKFRKFYEGLSDSVIPILSVCTVTIIGWLTKAASGSGITESDMILALFAAASGIGTIALWIICTFIRAHQIDKRAKNGGERI